MALLELFTDTHCPSRRRALSVGRRLRAAIPYLQFKERDLIQNSPIAESYHVFISPSFVFNGELVFIGVPDYEKFKNCLLKRMESQDEENQERLPQTKEKNHVG